jgi:hypothetical protein
MLARSRERSALGSRTLDASRVSARTTAEIAGPTTQPVPQAFPRACLASLAIDGRPPSWHR